MPLTRLVVNADVDVSGGPNTPSDLAARWILLRQSASFPGYAPVLPGLPDTRTPFKESGEARRIVTVDRAPSLVGREGKLQTQQLG